MLIFAFAVFVALVAVPVDGLLACCYPAKMEGARYYLKDQETRYFISDYERGYIFQTLRIGGPNFTIYDLQNEKKYTISGDKCSERAMLVPGLFDPCLDDDDLVRSNARLGGNDRTIDVDYYDYKAGKFNVFKAVRWSAEGCIPVMTQTQLGRLSLTTIYDSIHTDITFPQIFSALRKCGVEVREGNEENEDNEQEEDNK